MSFFCQRFDMDLDREYGIGSADPFLYTGSCLLGCNVIADNSFNIAIANGYTKLNNILVLLVYSLRFRVIGLPQKN
jgi:hypothetical protein